MAEPDRRERKKRRTREQIETAAIDLFAERGYADTTIGAIADRADVAVRTVSGHFASKDDLLFADEPFTAQSLETWLAGRSAGQPALDGLRDWMAATMEELTAERSEEFWRRRALRSRLILEDPALRARARGGGRDLEDVLAAAIASDLGVEPDALAPRLAALTAITGLREVYVTHEAEGAPTAGQLLALVDEVIAFARAGLDATG